MGPDAQQALTTYLWGFSSLLEKESAKECILGLYFLLKGQRELDTSGRRLSLKLKEQKGHDVLV